MLDKFNPKRNGGARVLAQSQITILPAVNRRCVVCGRDLPHGRRQKCYSCRPPRPHRPVDDPHPDLEYTLEDRVAQADARGMSYGNFMMFLHNGWKLPPKRKPVRWPHGSAHAGE